jgi:hypothetical protein
MTKDKKMCVELDGVRNKFVKIIFSLNGFIDGQELGYVVGDVWDVGKLNYG